MYCSLKLYEVSSRAAVVCAGSVGWFGGTNLLLLVFNFLPLSMKTIHLFSNMVSMCTG